MWGWVAGGDMMCPEQWSSDERWKERRETYPKDGEMYLFTTGVERSRTQGRGETDECKREFICEIARENMNRNGGTHGRTRREERER
jgi:hypothetical protein